MKKLLLFVAFCTALFAVETSNIAAVSSENSKQISTQIHSNAYGAHLFSGQFRQANKHVYNPNYKITLGDVINIKIWGAADLEFKATVDSRGNIFIPQVGVVNVLGAKSEQIQSIVQRKIKQIYKSNVYSYAEIDSYQLINVFVTGYVQNPGLFSGLSSDSVVQFIDKAGGINTKSGSFRNIVLLRENKKIAEIDLYDFLRFGKIERPILRDGDVILIKSLQESVIASGEVLRSNQFELKNDLKTVADLAEFAGAKSTATNAIIKSFDANNKASLKQIEKKDFAKTSLKAGDIVEFRPDFTADKISIKISGEHDGLHELVLKKSSTLKDALALIKSNARSDLASVQIYRKSLAKMQKELINAQLKELETLALTTTSSTSEEARIRGEWSKQILQFIERARAIEPKGQIIASNSTDIALEDGDEIVIPSKSKLVLLQGEVALPSTFVKNDKLKLKDYIKMAGGFSVRADKKRILLIHADGKADLISLGFFSSGPKLKGGESVLVLPKVKSYNLQIAGLVSQIVYQIAVATKVILDI